MSEGRYSPSSFDHADGSEAHHSVSNNGYVPAQPVESRESLDVNGAVPPTPTKSTSPPRSSTESPTRFSNQRWRDSTLPAPAVEAADVDGATLVEPSFDENVLRALCDLDVRLRHDMDYMLPCSTMGYTSVVYHYYWIE